MLFNSLAFFIFFPLVTALFYLLPHRFRWMLLLTASCYFYMFFIPVYILILFGTIVIDYFAGIKLEETLDPARRKLFLRLSLVSNIGILAIFKYYNFFLDNINDLSYLLFDSPTAARYLAIALPVGLSFHTFQAMSYILEVYYGRQKAERHFGLYALYVMFYPQLVAGPIERPQNILHQFREEKTFEYPGFTSGIGLMIWGLFKKMVIADNIAGLVDRAYAQPDEAGGTALLITSYLFAIQIYCDFSGYSDIAIGAARTMGYNLMENFRTPYLSTSIREFWSRWHISLSTWFRDYLYISLGGNRSGHARWMTNLFIVFLVSGFWHGASWTFILWGALHGTYLIAGIATDHLAKHNPKLDGLLNKRGAGFMNRLITFHLVVFAWIFFRAENVGHAISIIGKIAAISPDISDFSSAVAFLAKNPGKSGNVVFIFALVAAFMAIDPWMDRIVKGKVIFASAWPYFVIFPLITAALLLFGYFGEISFIYFQF